MANSENYSKNELKWIASSSVLRSKKSPLKRASLDADADDDAAAIIFHR